MHVVKLLTRRANVVEFFRAHGERRARERLDGVDGVAVGELFDDVDRFRVPLVVVVDVEGSLIPAAPLMIGLRMSQAFSLILKLLNPF